MIDECRICECSKWSSMHGPVESCRGCKAPQDHHDFEPLSEAEWRAKSEEEEREWTRLDAAMASQG